MRQRFTCISVCKCSGVLMLENQVILKTILPSKLKYSLFVIFNNVGSKEGQNQLFKCS